MKSVFLPAALALSSGLATPLMSQAAAVAAPVTVAVLNAPAAPSVTAASLPDAPSVNYTVPAESLDDQVSVPAGPIAGRYNVVILPGQRAVELHGTEKIVFGLNDAFTPTSLVGIAASAGYSHVVNSAPHFGTNSVAFGKRFGAAALRSTVQTITTDSIFSPMFHDDPRYYAMGNTHPFFNRVVYAATRVVVTRSSHSLKQRVNAPVLLGYGVAAGLNNAYYPDQDRGGVETAKNWATSLGGAALGFEVYEFLDDALRAVHLRRN